MMQQSENSTDGRKLRIRATLFIALIISGLIAGLLAWKAPQQQIAELAPTSTPALSIVVAQRKKTVVAIGRFPIANASAKLTKTGDLNLLELKFPDGGTFTAQFIGTLPEDYSMMSYRLGGQAYTYLWNTDGSNQLMTEGILTIFVNEGNYTLMVPTKSGRLQKLYIDF